MSFLGHVTAGPMLISYLFGVVTVDVLTKASY